ncbi:outer membrane beta-barrel protein [Flavivirga eckloniae]|uniref:Outer membrane protein beta-barrel domain-containing protein n=1 Tax=Flavivirga eckloniae TaxID=1803846 RepID=A0A2K9PTU4_9FLAO|nr:OmpW family outer membrane protein [Flavivirga eckloniae]AUP79987.1 hypothetical protein C1H87_15270 [Flavivirga eckloniae]
MKKLIILSCIAVLFINNITSAQGRNLLTANWDINFPNSDLNDFLHNEDVSLAGLSFDYRYFVKENVSVGTYFAWDFFNGSSREISNLENADVSGLKLFYVNYFPFMLNAHYYLNESENIQPYLGGGMGAVRSLQRTEVGSVALENNNWHFGLYPEVGVLIPFSSDGGLSIGAKYNVAFETSDSFTYSYFSINIGITGIFDY